MKLSEYLPQEHITTNLKNNNKFPVIEELLDLLAQNGKVADRELALKDVLAREGYLSTGLENGIAIPHAKTDGVDQLLIAFGIKKEGLDFASLDGKPAQLIFLVLSPRDVAGPHIQTLAIISRALKEEATRRALLQVSSAAEAAGIIKEKFNS